ncbi:MAG: hypothetical protein ABSG73_01750 [Candidatus Aminicenantales bacterium]|jgi:hypothetical protein
MTREIILVNRAPVLTLWAAVVAEQLGFDHEAALSLGKALAGMNAQSKGRSLGIYKPAEHPEVISPMKARLGEEFWVELLGRPIPAITTEKGVRAVVKDKPVDPAGVERYLQEKFGAGLRDVEKAMGDLARSFKRAELAAKAYSLYERFRPDIPAGVRGWGVKGELDLGRIRTLESFG